jgi:hypothetical protein
VISYVTSIGILAGLVGAHWLAWRLERPWREALEERRRAALSALDEREAAIESARAPRT